MIEKLIIGRYIDMSTMPAPPAVGPEVNGVQEYSQTFVHLAESEHLKRTSMTSMLPNNASAATRFAKHVTSTAHKVKDKFTPQRTSNVVAGSHVSKAHRNLVWLPYVPGKVTIVQAPTNVEVLTGPLSGCWVTKYVRGGLTYIAHVGTEGAPDTANSMAAKKAWNDFVNSSNPPTSITGFNAMRHWQGAYTKDVSCDGGDYLMGLVTGAGNFHAILSWKDRNVQTRLRIAASQPMANRMAADGLIT